MVENMVHPRKHLCMDEITTSDILLGLSDPEFSPETFNPNSEIESSSNEEPYPHPMQQYSSSSSTQDHTNGKTGRPPDPLFDETGPTIQLDQDTSASMEFINMSPAFTTPESENQSNQQELYNMASFINHNHHFTLGDQTVRNGDNIYSHDDQWPALAAPPPPQQPVVHQFQMNLAIPSGFDEGLSSMTPPPPPPSSYTTLSNSSLLDPMIAARCVSMTPQYSSGNSGIFAESFRNHDLFSQQDLDFQGEKVVPFLPHDTMQRYLNNCTSELQALSSESQHLVHGGSSCSTTPLSSEITGFDDPSFKAGKLSVEERMRKVDRYKAKRNERNFSKKIKYACRKTLADSRPRVRGRFAKNDELGELTRINGGNQEDEIDDICMFSNNSIASRHWGKMALAVKEEDDTAYGADLFSHMSAMNSLKCNYPNNHGFDR